MTDPRPTSSSNIPYRFEQTEGERNMWCACGRSGAQPLCDNESHKGTGVRPKMFKADASISVALCGCKLTRNPPYCDGSHVQIEREK